MSTNGHLPSGRPRLAVIGVVAALAAVGAAVALILALGGGGATTAPAAASSAPSPTVPASPTVQATPATPTPTPTTPAFAFHLSKFGSERGSSKTRVKVIRTRTRRAVHTIRDELARMYRLAFLDPAAWLHARYGPAFRFFAGNARASARDHLGLLTLGPFAGKQFERVTAPNGTLKVRLLLDRGGHPVTAVANATFHVRAEQVAGGALLIRSDASYFLRPSKHGWLIFGFDVRRKDKQLP